MAKSRTWLDGRGARRPRRAVPKAAIKDPHLRELVQRSGGDLTEPLPFNPKKSRKGMGLETCLKKQHTAYMVPAGPVYAGQPLPKPAGPVMTKIPTAMAVVQSPDDEGQAAARFMRGGARIVDYVGSAPRTGRGIAIEAKECSGDTFNFDVLTDEQIGYMRAFHGSAFLLVHAVAYREAFLVPAEVFLTDYDAGVRSWPVKAGEKKRIKKRQALNEAGEGLGGAFDWYAAACRRGWL